MDGIAVNYEHSDPTSRSWVDGQEAKCKDSVKELQSLSQITVYDAASKTCKKDKLLRRTKCSRYGPKPGR